MWDLLDIQPTTELKLIKKAYATQLRKINPTEQPADFQRLKKAFDRAMNWAKAQKSQTSSSEERGNQFSVSSSEFYSQFSLLENSNKEEFAWTLEKEASIQILSESAASNSYKATWELQSESASLENSNSSKEEFNWTLGKEIPSLAQSESDVPELFELPSEQVKLRKEAPTENELDWKLAETDVELDSPVSQTFKVKKPKRKQTAPIRTFFRVILIVALFVIGMNLFFTKGKSSPYTPTVTQSSSSSESSDSPSISETLKPIDGMDFVSAFVKLELLSDLPNLIEAKLSLSPSDYSNNKYYQSLKAGVISDEMLTKNQRLAALGLDNPDSSLNLQQMAIASSSDPQGKIVKTSQGYLAAVVVEYKIVAYVQIPENSISDESTWQVYGTFWGDSQEQLSALDTDFASGTIVN